jgi:HPt (histidine-containing phosphotransfer) domain-containing protein
MKGDRERCLEVGMNEYASKPIQSKELFETIERLIPTRIKTRPSATARPSIDEIIDRAAVLDRCDGDAELLMELVELFLGDCSKRLSAIREAIAARDGKTLERAAHEIKGSISNFAAKAAFEAALKLEQIGRGGNMGCAQDAYRALEKEIERLKPALAALVEEKVS